MNGFWQMLPHFVIFFQIKIYLPAQNIRKKKKTNKQLYNEINEKN